MKRCSIGYNTPELLSEFVIVSAVNSCIYSQMLSRLDDVLGGTVVNGGKGSRNIELIGGSTFSTESWPRFIENHSLKLS